MKQATEIYAPRFDRSFFRLPVHLQNRIQERIHALGRVLDTYSHERLQGRSEFRLRIGDYRVIYEIDPGRNELYLLEIGHRREVYRH